MQEIHCRKGEIIRLEEGSTVHCTEGILWITWKGSGDTLLRGGESVSIPQHTQAIGESLAQDSSIIKIRRTKPGEEIKTGRFPAVLSRA